MSDLLFPPFPVPEDLALRATEKGWPPDLLQRAVNLGYERPVLEQWLQVPVEALPQLDRAFQPMERLRFGDLRARSLMVGDLDGFARLWECSTEEFGEFDLVVERRPNAVAQFRLQDDVEIVILEHRTVVVACIVWAHRNVVIQGEELHILLSQGLRVHDQMRRQGLSSLVRTAGRSPLFNRVNGEVSYFRSLNRGVVGMMNRTTPRWRLAQTNADAEIPGLPVSVHQLEPGDISDDDIDHTGIRPATRDDLPACAALINRTHGDLDLFEPCDPWLLGHRLDEYRRGRPMPSWMRIYGWPQFRVVEEDGEIVACGGLWDRGKHVRERWTHRATGETHVLAATNLLDFGWADGKEAAIARLLSSFLVETRRRERTHLIAPLQHHPEILEHLPGVRCTPETRALQWRMFDPATGADIVDPEPRVERPFTDLRYW